MCWSSDSCYPFVTFAVRYSFWPEPKSLCGEEHLQLLDPGFGVGSPRRRGFCGLGVAKLAAFYWW